MDPVKGKALTVLVKNACAMDLVWDHASPAQEAAAPNPTRSTGLAKLSEPHASFGEHGNLQRPQQRPALI